MTVDRIEAWLRMRDVARFTKDAAEAAVAIRSIGKASVSTESQHAMLAKTAEQSRVILRGVGTAALYTVGGLGLLTGAASAAGLALGIKFNANMEQLEVAFANFLGSTGKARTYLEDLYQIAAKTPFEFPDLSAAARKFLAFGFEANETKEILMNVGDAVAGIGGGAEEINRMVLAFGQIKAKGRVQSEELLQFAELGIPAYQILRDELGMTQKELQKALQTGSIMADEAIPALSRGLNETFGGSSAKQAKTFNGQLSTMKDNAQLLLGILSKPAFNFLKKNVLPAANRALGGATAWARGGGPARARSALAAGFREGGQGPATAGFQGFDQTMVKVGGVAKTVFGILKTGFTIVKGVVEDFLDAIKPAEPFFSNVLLPLFKGLAIGILGNLVMAWKILIFVIKMFATALGFVGKILKPFSGVIQFIGTVIGFVFGGAILKVIGLVSKFAKILSWPIRIVDTMIGVFVGAIAIFLKFRGGLKYIGMAASWLISKLGPLWNLVKVGAKWWGRIGFLVGPWLVKKFLNLVRPIGVVRGAFALFRGTLRLVSAVLGAIVKAMTWIIDNADKLVEKLPKLGGTGPLGAGKGGGLLGLGGIDKFKFWATGGTIRPGDVGIVGEAGPELAMGGSGGVQIQPLSRGGGKAEIGGVIHLKTTVVSVVAGREVARATADQTADWNARKGKKA